MNNWNTFFQTNKPEIITYYNFTKSEIDVVDELKVEYSVSRVNSIWPIIIFFSQMYFAGTNSQIIYHENTDNYILLVEIIYKVWVKNLSKNLWLTELIYQNWLFHFAVQLSRSQE